MSNTSIRVRYAPSPTGFQHVGGARTALYNYLYARKTGGTFVLRIEDTDQERSTEESLRMVIQDLDWLGLKWQEGPSPKDLVDVGPHPPYRQSRRLDIYKKYAEQLMGSGHAYYCFMSEEEIEKQKETLLKAGRTPHVESPWRDRPQSEALAKLEKGEKAVVRFKVPKPAREYVLNDLIRGEVRFPSDMVGDFVLLRSDGMPVYNFCCVIDDALMKISHVLRAEEHLSNTVRQMMIYEGLGWSLPQFGHLSIILGPDRQKLSKRHGATSVNEYRLNGYLPEALNNFIALLGWSSPKGQEIMSMQEMIDQFSLDRFNPAPAVFDETKLKWVNATHLRALPHAELYQRIQPFLQEAGLKLPQHDADWIERAMAVFKTSMETLKDAVGLLSPLSEAPLNFSNEADEVLKWPRSKDVIGAWKDKIAAHSRDYLTVDEFEAIQNGIKDQLGVKGKELFQPIRVAVIGHPQGAELKNLVPLMKKSMLIERAASCLAKN